MYNKKSRLSFSLLSAISNIKKGANTATISKIPVIGIKNQNDMLTNLESIVLTANTKIKENKKNGMINEYPITNPTSRDSNKLLSHGLVISTCMTTDNIQAQKVSAAVATIRRASIFISLLNNR
jgi:hypothetical protein